VFNLSDLNRYLSTLDDVRLETTIFG